MGSTQKNKNIAAFLKSLFTHDHRTSSLQVKTKKLITENVCTWRYLIVVQHSSIVIIYSICYEL